MPAASAQADPAVKAAANRLLTGTTHRFITDLLEWVDKNRSVLRICAYGFGTGDESRTDVREVVMWCLIFHVRLQGRECLLGNAC